MGKLNNLELHIGYMQERMICHIEKCPLGNTFHKNSTIVELPDGDFLAAWFGNQTVDGSDRTHEQNVYGSRFHSETGEWGEPEVLIDVPDRAVGSPVLFNGPGDDLWLIGPQMYGNQITSSRLFYKRSSDNGFTWSDMQLLHDRYLYTKNKPLYLESEDRYLLGVDIMHSGEDAGGFLVIPGDLPNRPADFPNLVGGDQIVPGGWMSSPGMIYPTATELSDGTILAYLRPRPGGYIWETQSSDRGYNWAKAKQTNIPNPNAGFDLHRTNSGNHILVNNPIVAEIGDGRHELALFMSEDDCNSWPYQFYLEREDPDNNKNGVDRPDGVPEDDEFTRIRQQWVGKPEFTYGNIIQDSKDNIHIVYEYRSSGIKHVEITEEEIRERGNNVEIVPDIT